MGSIRRGVVFVAGCPMGRPAGSLCPLLQLVRRDCRSHSSRSSRTSRVPGAATTDELELRYATAGALAGTTNRLYADCNSGFEVRYRSVPTVQSGYTITH